MSEGPWYVCGLRGQLGGMGFVQLPRELYRLTLGGHFVTEPLSSSILTLGVQALSLSPSVAPQLEFYMLIHFVF